MRTHLAAAAAACLFATQARAIEPDCKPPTVSVQRVFAVLERSGALVMQLEGSEAKRFLDYANGVGEPTHFTGEHILIGLRPGQAAARIGIVHGGCVGLEGFTLDLGTVSAALAAARDPGV